MQKDVYMCFIDYAKDFDKVRHQELFEDLDTLDLYRKDVHLLASLYWNQTACTQRDGEYSEYIKIRRGARQGCVMSPDLFNYCSEMILWELEVEKGLKVGGQNITNLRYADYTVYWPKSVEDLQKLLDVVVRKSELKGLPINCKKTECMVFSKKKDIPRCSLKVKDQIIRSLLLTTLVVQSKKMLDAWKRSRKGLSLPNQHSQSETTSLGIHQSVRGLECKYWIAIGVGFSYC